jgi:hypothetical protein
MHYELWDLKTANLVGEYATEEEALADVRAALADGWDPEELGLGQEWDDGEDGDDANLAPTLSGAALAARVGAVEAGRRPLQA